jgi:small nuclear ribonucleoprotein G
MSKGEEKAAPMNPVSLIYRYVDKRVTVYLKGGEKYEGILAKVDGYMNLVLEDTVEEKTNKSAKYGKVLIRGNNILLIRLG